MQILSQHVQLQIQVIYVYGNKVIVEYKNVRILMVVMMKCVIHRKKDVLVMEQNVFCQNIVHKYL